MRRVTLASSALAALLFTACGDDEDDALGGQNTGSETGTTGFDHGSTSVGAEGSATGSGAATGEGDTTGPGCVDACELGSRNCSSDTQVQECQMGPQGCSVWVSAMACTSGTRCEQGNCIAGCDDPCPEGARRCEGIGGFVECTRSSNECASWGSPVACAVGEICSGGSCSQSCNDQCATGATQCAGATSVQMCAVAEAGCTDWTVPVPCPEGQVCSGGSCRSACLNQCVEGSQQCSGVSGVARCELQVTGCTDWSAALACAPGEICSGGQCSAVCTNQCAVGAQQCSGVAGVQHCELQPTGCSDWSSALACAAGEICSGGSCTAVCTNQCAVGSSQCSGSNAVETCQVQPTGCTDWSSALLCGTGEVCSGGLCTAQCSDQCSAGSQQCSGVNAYQTCETQGTGCTDWSSAILCGQGQICSGGRCTDTCSNQCVQDAVQCAGVGGFQKCDVQPTGCTDWSTTMLCTEGQICSGGQCVDTCTNQCLTGAMQCAGTGGVQECIEQPSGCTDWGTATPCDEGAICSGGVCMTSCVNQCTPETRQCASATEFQICGVQDSGCSDWSMSMACGQGQVCSAGECADTCTNQCVPEQKQCSAGNEVEVCEVQPSGCSDWVTEQVCGDGQVCANGACTSTCTNECALGTKSCGGDGVQTCQTGPDGCTQWGPNVACPAETECLLGHCVSGSADWQSFDGVTNADLMDVWAAHENAIWAVGSDATALFFDGEIWRSQDVGAASGKRLRCVDGTSDSNVFAITETGEIYRFDGTSWKLRVNIEYPAGDRESACVAAAGIDQAYAVHWDGREATLYSIDGETAESLMSWVTLYPGVGGSAQTRSFSMSMVGPGHLWLTDQYLREWKDDRLGGLDRDSGIKAYARLFMLPDGQAWMSNGSTGRHYDGSSFSTINPGAGGLINDFAGTAPNRIFAIGQYDNDTRSGFAHKYDGLGWQALSLPDDTATLMAAWAFPSGEVVLVGRDGEILLGRP